MSAALSPVEGERATGRRREGETGRGRGSCTQQDVAVSGSGQSSP